MRNEFVERDGDRIKLNFRYATPSPSGALLIILTALRHSNLYRGVSQRTREQVTR